MCLLPVGFAEDVLGCLLGNHRVGIVEARDSSWSARSAVAVAASGDEVLIAGREVNGQNAKAGFRAGGVVRMNGAIGVDEGLQGAEISGWCCSRSQSRCPTPS